MASLRRGESALDNITSKFQNGAMPPLKLNEKCSDVRGGHERGDSLVNSIEMKNRSGVIEDTKEDEPQIRGMDNEVKEYTDYSSLVSVKYQKYNDRKDTRTPDAYGSARKTVIELQSYHSQNKKEIPGQDFSFN